MVFADRNEFDGSTMISTTRRRVSGRRALPVFDLTPKKDAGRAGLSPHLVEDQISTSSPQRTYSRSSRNNYYFHMDSWRLNLVPDTGFPLYLQREGDFTAEPRM